MISRSNAVFLGIFALAVVATVLMFTVGPGLVSGPAASGKLSPATIDVEVEYKAIQKEWNENEKAFLEAKPQVSLKLTGIQEKLKALALKSETLEGATKAERDALPHLVGSIHALFRVTDPYVVRLMAPARIGTREWDKMKADTKEANAEWDAWQKATSDMSR